MKIMPNRLDRGFYMYQKEFEDKALEVLRSGWWPADWMRCGWRSAFWASEQETK